MGSIAGVPGGVSGGRGGPCWAGAPEPASAGEVSGRVGVGKVRRQRLPVGRRPPRRQGGFLIGDREGFAIEYEHGIAGFRMDPLFEAEGAGAGWGRDRGDGWDRGGPGTGVTVGGVGSVAESGGAGGEAGAASADAGAVVERGQPAPFSDQLGVLPLISRVLVLPVTWTVAAKVPSGPARFNCRSSRE